jgi:DNA-binding GntR family transcriptional regulator
LEAEAARLALQHMTSADVDALQAYIERFEAARQEADLQGLITCDVEFHHIVVKASQHTKLFDMYKTLDTQLSAMFLTIRNRAPMRIAQVAEIHQELVDALRSRDEEVVMNAFRDHYVKAWQAIAMVNPNEQ